MDEGKSKVYIFGDSHARYFEISKKIVTHAPWTKGMSIDLHKIPASTIIGLGRNRSKLSINNLVSEVLEKDFNSIRVFCFGQVDLELGYYYRKVVKGEDIEFDSFIDYLIDQYECFIKKFDNGKVHIKGLNLTVLKDRDFAIKYVSRIISENIDSYSEKELLNKKLSEVFDSFSIRNKATLNFNEKMKKISKKNSWGYFDVNNEISNYTPGKGVADIYIPSGNDHHLIDSINVRLLHLSYIKGLL